MTVWVLVVGLLMNLIALPIAGKRIGFLYRLITSGQPAPDRVENVRERVGETVKDQLVKVLGQKKLLKWSVPGARTLLRVLGVPDPGDGLPRGLRHRCSPQPASPSR